MALHKVLVVEDAEVDLMYIETIIAGAGYQVITATSGEQAIDRAKADEPDLIFMDVNMKKVDGFQVTRTLHAAPETKSIPVIFITGRHQQADRVWAQLLGGKGYVPKPCSAEQILDELKLAA